MMLMSETIEENMDKDKEILNLKERMNAMQESQKEILELLEGSCQAIRGLKAKLRLYLLSSVRNFSKTFF